MNTSFSSNTQIQQKQSGALEQSEVETTPSVGEPRPSTEELTIPPVDELAPPLAGELMPPPAGDFVPPAREMELMPPPEANATKRPKPKRQKPRKIPWQSIEFTRIGQRIAYARRSLGLTQLMLANRSGTHQGTISQIEAGKRDVKFSLMIRVCKAVGLEFGVYPPVWVPPKE